MRHRSFYVTCAAAALFLTYTGSTAWGQISYGTSGVEISENFDGFPLDIPNNANIETLYVNGWADNTTTVASSTISLPGWYLRHNVSPASENGTDGNERLRAGVGANTGAFWLFSNTNAANPEKALGSIGSTTVASNGVEMFIGMRLTNNTGSTLNSFTVTYDGEQWRDGESAGPETLNFAYNLGATVTNWYTTSFTPVPALSFTSPVISGTSSGGTAVDGNVAGKLVNITSTIFGVSWDPGQDLWLRWGDPQLTSLADDGLAIDNVRFIAPGTGPSPDIDSFQSGNASAGSTWVGGQPPAIGNTYHVLSGHTVTVDAAFAGTVLKAESGGTIDIGTGGNGQHIQYMIIEPTGNLTESVSGDFSLGDPTNSNETLELKRDVTFTIDPGAPSATCDLCLNMKLTGTGNVTVNSADDSSLSIKKAATLGGTVIFNGTGDTVKLDGTENTARLQMNSTGDNRVQFLGGGVGTNLTFNQPGIVDHLTTTATRLQGPSTLVANANITVNETTGYPDNTTQSDERRFLPGALQGAGNITVNGTAANYTNNNGSVLLNEFELGGTPQPTGNLSNSTYRGTITANDYLNVEMRENTIRAGYVINANSRLEFGHQVAHANQSKLLSTGEITVNSGGTLEVGFEQGAISGSPFYTHPGNTHGSGHHAYHLNITSLGGRSGGLTMSSGSTMRMQINGTPAEVDQWDSISATGNVVLTGSTIDLLINPQATEAGDQNGAYSPSIGDTFNIITIAPAPVPGDYDRDGTVEPVDDYDVWRAAYGNTAGIQAADGNNNTEVDMADYVIWREHLGQTQSVTGTITGTPTLNILDPQGWLTGVTFTVTNLGTTLQLEVVSAGAFTAVPEPSTITLIGLMMGLLATRRGTRRIAR